MKKYLLLTILLPTIVCAQDAVQMVPVPDWLGWVLQWLMSMPKVGPSLVVGLQVLGALAVFLTALSALLVATSKAIEVSLNKVGLTEKAEMVKSLLDKVVYYLQYFSMFNAKK